MATEQWFVYIAKCSDGSLYTGCSNNLAKRIATHNLGKGAKYTRSRLPVQLVYSESHKSFSDALKREIQIKKLTRQQKAQLIQTL